ncbi:MAG TPA: hypothetical protein VNR61_21090 [Niallia sp.]|nr:hypothetical protein [Niallia sp.]
MYIQDKKTLYVISYENNCYYYMDFKRVDWINGKCYVTFQQIDTGKWFTFEKNTIQFTHSQKENLVS